MATAMFGAIAEFCVDTDTFTEWAERLEQWFIANSVVSEDKKRAYLLSLMGSRGYKLLRSLAQNKPTDKTYDELTKLMKDHLQPKPNEIAQRYVFYKRDRKTGESVKDYVANLRKLSEHCNFETTLDVHLRDRLVCGLNDERIQQKLLATRNLKLQDAIDTAVAMEAAVKSARELHGPRRVDEGLYKLADRDRDVNVLRRECFRCGSTAHLADACMYKMKECFGCKRTGHLKRKCPNLRKRGRGHFGGGMSRVGCNKADVVHVDDMSRISGEDEDGGVESGMNFLSLYTLESKNKGQHEPVMVVVSLNGVAVSMEVDTGAAVSVMSAREYQRIKGESLGVSDIRLKTYTGEVVKPRGVGKLSVTYKGQEMKLPITVIEGNAPCLLGRDWLTHLKLSWNELFPVSINSLEIDRKVEEIKSRYPQVFSGNLGCLKDFQVHIPVPADAQPRYCKPRTVPYALRARVEEELDKLEKQGVWSKVEYSKWAAPIVPVLNDSKDPCGDYKMTVNRIAPCDNYPIPNTTEQLATLAGGEKFSKIDLSQAYQQLELDEPSRELLTISTHKGLYRPRRLQFGVHSATGIFQREIEKRLTGIPSVKVRVDDILVSGKNDREHLENLEKVVQRLSGAGLTVKPSKCAFLQDEVTYCGYRISKDGVKPMISNVEAVKKAPEPRNVSELKSYLGMLNYYQNYLPSLSTVSEPLHRLLRKSVEWKWEEQQAKAFKQTKNMLTVAPLLVHFNPVWPIVVHADASPYGIGAVLSHVMPDGSERPVCYASRTLSVAERNYGHIEKEGLALVFAVKKLHHYLYGHKFTMMTDHKPLLGLFAEDKGLPDKSAARILRWALLLSAYDYKLEYRPGISNANADGLSRLPVEALPEDFSTSKLVSSPVTEAGVREETEKDKILTEVLSKVRTGWHEGKSVNSKEELRPYKSRMNELVTEGGCLLWGTRVIIPAALREAVLRQLHEIHPGIIRMKALARSFVWWPGMDEAIEASVKGCRKCQQHQSNPARAPVHPWEYPKGPWERLHLDFAGPFMGKMFLIIVDAFSKWVEVEIMSSATATATVTRLRRNFAMHGLPQVVVTDNGPAFVGQEFKVFLRRNGIRHLLTAPYHPASNGQVERMVRTFKESMKTLEFGDMETKLSRLLFKYRITPHTTTGKTPAELLFNRQLRSAFHLLRPGELTKVGEKANEDRKDRKGTRNFGEGDQVWVRNFGIGNKWLPGTVMRRLGSVNYEILVEGAEGHAHRHVDQMVQRLPGMDRRAEQVDLLPDVLDATVGSKETGDVVLKDNVSIQTENVSVELPVEAVTPFMENAAETVVPVIENKAPRRSDRVRNKPQWMTDDFVVK